MFCRMPRASQRELLGKSSSSVRRSQEGEVRQGRGSPPGKGRSAREGIGATPTCSPASVRDTLACTGAGAFLTAREHVVKAVRETRGSAGDVFINRQVENLNFEPMKYMEILNSKYRLNI